MDAPKESAETVQPTPIQNSAVILQQPVVPPRETVPVPVAMSSQVTLPPLAEASAVSGPPPILDLLRSQLLAKKLPGQSQISDAAAYVPMTIPNLEVSVTHAVQVVCWLCLSSLVCPFHF